jgi:hypothetical protein
MKARETMCKTLDMNITDLAIGQLEMLEKKEGVLIKANTPADFTQEKFNENYFVIKNGTGAEFRIYLFATYTDLEDYAKGKKI